jgi:Cu/Ag efflux protein CusF
MSRSNHTALRIAAALTLLCLGSPCCAAQNYPASGVVLKVDRSHRSIQVSCREIPGYMAAMVMDFPVREDRELDSLSPGTMIDFTLVVTENSAHAESVRVRQFQSADQEPMAARQLNLISHLVDPASNAIKPLSVGQRVPDFSLISHRHEPIRLSQFVGSVVGITFLYTH